jgi:hypothetical protein
MSAQNHVIVGSPSRRRCVTQSKEVLCTNFCGFLGKRFRGRSHALSRIAAKSSGHNHFSPGIGLRLGCAFCRTLPGSAGVTALSSFGAASVGELLISGLQVRVLPGSPIISITYGVTSDAQFAVVVA